VRLVLALVLVGSAVAKLAAPASSRAALGTFGIEAEWLRWMIWAGLVAVEIVLAVGVAAGLPAASYAAAGLMAAFALALGVALARGRGGAPCACFGSRSTVSAQSVGRNALLAAAFLVAPLIPSSSLNTDQWLGLGLGAALLACAGLALAVLALAREVGMLRLRLGPDSALEIPDEGPELGSPSPLIQRFEPGPAAELALAVFVSSGCRACRALGPAVESLRGDPVLVVETFDEVADSAAWGEADVPGSPYAVALDRRGTVLAKGTFNNLAQLESVIATAGRRRSLFAATESLGG
jgi:Methylamine utilisation protein MauE